MQGWLSHVPLRQLLPHFIIQHFSTTTRYSEILWNSNLYTKPQPSVEDEKGRLSDNYRRQKATILVQAPYVRGETASLYIVLLR